MPFDLGTNVVVPVCLADYTRPELIIPALKTRDPAGIISELTHALHREAVVPDLLPFYQAALNQELLASSGQDCGIAFPHARISSVRQLQFALGRLPQPLPWGSKGAWPVQFVFLIAVPASDAARYLHLLSCLARLGQRPELLARLRKAEDGGEMLDLLREVAFRRTAIDSNGADISGAGI